MTKSAEGLLFLPKNGWTKKKILEKIEIEFTTRALDESGHSCAYRGVGDARCAVGLFIPDEEYNSRMEGQSVDAVLKHYPELEKFMPLDVLALMGMQSEHDVCKGNVKEKLLSWVSTNVG